MARGRFRQRLGTAVRQGPLSDGITPVLRARRELPGSVSELKRPLVGAKLRGTAISTRASTIRVAGIALRWLRQLRV